MKAFTVQGRQTNEMKSLTFAALCAITVFALACGHPPPGRGAGEIETSPQSQTSFKVETVIPNLEVVWSIVWAPDGRMIFTERPGRVRVYENGKLRPEPLFTVPDVEPKGESGLMSVALHPQFAANHLLYLSYAYNTGGQLVRVVRYRETPNGLTDRKVIIEDIPAAQFHAGCRLRFGPDGKLYVTTGDATQRELAQQLNSLAGKILRLNDDGTVPSDNPFVGQQNARPEIWSYGHRNPQGIDWQPSTNLLWETEHGPSGLGMEAPVLESTPACAPASSMFYRGSALPQFKGNFFFGCLVGQRIIRVVTNGRTVVSQENLLEGKYGRIRDIAEGPDGFIYFSTSNRDGRGRPAPDDDRILRLVPVK